MMEFNKKNEFVYEIHYDISLACNNRCSYCYQLPYLDNSKLINHKVFESVIEQINTFKEQNPDYRLEIFIKGGEPLLIIDKVVEFIEGVYEENVTNIHIYTNLNFKPNGSKINRLLDLHKRIPIKLIVSVHESSNIEFIKENLSSIKFLLGEDCFIDIITENSDINFAVEFAQWSIQNFGVESYYVSPVIISELQMLNYEDDRLIPIIQNQRKLTNDVCIDDKHYTNQEAIDKNFKNISKQYMTICKINACSIRYDGTLKTLCEYPWTSSISEGLKIQKVFCRNHTCTCNLNSYKQLTNKK